MGRMLNNRSSNNTGIWHVVIVIFLYEMCALLFKMAVDLKRSDEDSVNELCDLVFGQFMLGNLYWHSANDHV